LLMTSTIHKSSLGIPYLSKTLNHILRHHIKSYVPTLKSKIKELLLSKDQELRVYGSENPCIESNKGALLLKYIGKYKETYSQILHGDCHDTSNVFIGGARINYIFQNVFSKEINQLDPMDNLDEQKIRTAIINAKGLSPSIFVPEQAFETLIRQQILRLKQPAENCVYMIYEELRKISNKTSFPELTNYEVLRQCIMEVMENVLAKCLKPTLKWFLTSLGLKSHLSILITPILRVRPFCPSSLVHMVTKKTKSLTKN
jgi:dynamin 1-like protein